MSANSECSLYDRRRKRLEEAENIRRWIVSIQERQFLDAQLARQKAEEERVATLHYEHICKQQRINGGRWYLKRKLRAEEIRTNTTGLVLAEEEFLDYDQLVASRPDYDQLVASKPDYFL